MPTEFGNAQKGDSSKGFEKLIFLGLFAVLLGGVPLISQIFGAFLPIPLCISFLVYGRRTGLLFSLIVFGALSFLHSLTKTTPNPVVITLYGVGLALIIAEFVKKNVHPTRAFLFGGFSLVTILGLLLFSSEFLFDFSIRELVEKKIMFEVDFYKTGPGAKFLAQGGENTRFIQDVIDKPKDYIEKVMSWIPSAVFSTFFLSWWANFYLVLRNDKTWRGTAKDYPYSLNDFLKFRVAEPLIWLLIAALGLFLGGETLVGDVGVNAGKNILVCLGIFYFFQGFGLLIDFLIHAKVFGMLRMLIFMSMIFLGMLSGIFLAVLGILDNFKDFRESFKKQSNDDEGDKL